MGLLEGRIAIVTGSGRAPRKRPPAPFCSWLRPYPTTFPVSALRLPGDFDGEGYWMGRDTMPRAPTTAPGLSRVVFFSRLI